MANPQPTDAHIRIAHTITEAIMQRDFSKRQRKILDLILRLSWGCGKKTATIPRQRDFMLVGIAETHVATELKWLQESKIINIVDSTYSFNKDFDQWQVSRVHPYEPLKLTELVSLNLKETSQNSKLELPKTVSENLPKREVGTSQNSKFGTSELASPKESIKENINKDIKKTTPPIVPPSTSSSLSSETLEKNVFELYETEGFGKITELTRNILVDAVETYTEDWVRDAIKEAVLQGQRKWSYVEGILKNWANEGRDVEKQDLSKSDPGRFLKGKYGHVVRENTFGNVKGKTIEEMQAELANGPP